MPLTLNADNKICQALEFIRWLQFHHNDSLLVQQLPWNLAR